MYAGVISKVLGKVRDAVVLGGFLGVSIEACGLGFLYNRISLMLPRGQMSGCELCPTLSLQVSLEMYPIILEVIGRLVLLGQP